MNKLTAMQVFKRVVELNGFSAAARDLRLSNAAVSKNVNQLEEHLGTQLLIRTTRKISVTEAGQEYYQRCVAILDDIAEADLLASATTSEPRGLLRINAPMSFGILHLAPAISEFMDRYSQVDIDLVMNDRVVDLVDNGFDIGLRVGDGLKDSTLIARTLSPVARAFCAAPSYLKKAGIPRTPDDLQDHVCLTYSLSSQHGSWPVSNHGETASVEIEGRYNVNNSLALREALLQGRGVTLTPTFIVGDDIKTGRLKSILTAYTPPPQTLYAVYPQARHVSQKVRVFVDFLAERFRASPYWDD